MVAPTIVLINKYQYFLMLLAYYLQNCLTSSRLSPKEISVIICHKNIKSYRRLFITTIIIYNLYTCMHLIRNKGTATRKA